MARYLVGSLVVLGLAACGRSWLAEREPWRHEAEVACLKSGLVKEGPAVVRLEPITGPGICGADFPFKVSALGDASALGYTDVLRPPGAVPGRHPLADPPISDVPQTYSPPAASPYPRQQQRAYPAEPYRPQHYPPQPQSYPPQQANGPMPISPPGAEPPEADDEGEYQQGAPETAPPANYPQRAAPFPQRAVPAAPPAYPPPAAEQVPLGPERAPLVTAVAVVQPATLACPVISALDTWIATGVQPAAMRWFGQPVASVRQYSAYSCRSVNNQPGKALSEHAFGNALDIAVFVLADGRKISVKDGWRGAPEEQGFLRDAHASACKHFTTVLGPGADIFHYDHFHVDMRRRTSSTICRPAPVPGDAVAGRSPYPRRGDPTVTGSIKPAGPATRASRMPAQRIWRNRDEIYDGLPRAVPGED